MKKAIPLSLSAVALLLTSPAFAERKWEGMYFGGTLSHTNSKNKTDKIFGNNGATPPVGWTEGQFLGDVAHALNSMDTFGIPVFSETRSIELSDWNSKENSTKSVMGLGVLLGKNIQQDEWVLGGEVRLNFGNFGSVTNQSYTGSGSGHSSFEGGRITFTNYNSVLSVTSPFNSGDVFTSHEVNYTQLASERNEVKYNAVSQLVGRVGYDLGDVMIYGAAGIALANVRATTSATIQESASGRYVSGIFSPPLTGGTTYSGSATYRFSGSKSKNMLGYAVGVGAEWKVQEDMSFRLETMYYDLGKMGVTATSSDTAATYRVNHKVSAYNIGISLIKRF
jgi:opacity protein-like surface antigen